MFLQSDKLLQQIYYSRRIYVENYRFHTFQLTNEQSFLSV